MCDFEEEGKGGVEVKGVKMLIKFGFYVKPQEFSGEKGIVSFGGG